LHEGIFLEVVLVLGEVRKTFGYVGAGINNDNIPVNATKEGLVVVQHWHYLELKDQLVSAMGAIRDIFNFILARHPKWLDVALML